MLQYLYNNDQEKVREGLFELTAIAGLTSPTQFTRDHIVYHSYFRTFEKMKEIK